MNNHFRILLFYHLLSFYSLTYIEYYMDLYQLSTQSYFKDSISISIMNHQLIISSFKAVRLYYDKECNPTSFTFTSLVYSIVFNLSIINSNGIKYTMKNMIIEHQFNSITFDIQKDKTFKANIIHDKSNCTFYFMDYFNNELFSKILENNKDAICLKISLGLVEWIQRFTLKMPPNRDLLNFDNYIIELGKMTDSRAIECDYKLNSTYRLLDLSFDDILYERQVQLGDFSRFTDVYVYVSYSIIDLELIIRREMSHVRYEFINYGKTKFNFSENMKGRKELSYLIQKEMNRFYRILEYEEKEDDDYNW